MKRIGVVGELGLFHTDIIQAGKEYFQEIKEEYLSTSTQRWEASNNTIRNREPFRFRNFKASSSRLHKHSNMILTMALEWIGCWYRSSIILYPQNSYHSDYNLMDQEVNQAFAMLKKKNGFRLYKEEVYPAYSLTRLHLNHLIA